MPERTPWIVRNDRLATAIRRILWNNTSLLSPSLRRERPSDVHPLYGHCYVASEAYYHRSGRELTPMTLTIDNTTHWYLRDDQNGEYTDLTAEQFRTTPEYTQGRGRGFPVPGGGPSKRSQTVLEQLSPVVLDEG